MKLKLKTILDAITDAETKIVPLFVHNPVSQEIAGIAFLGEQAFFSFLERMHATAPVAAVAPAAAPEAK